MDLSQSQIVGHQPEKFNLMIFGSTSNFGASLLYALSRNPLLLNLVNVFCYQRDGTNTDKKNKIQSEFPFVTFVDKNSWTGRFYHVVWYLGTSYDLEIMKNDAIGSALAVSTAGILPFFEKNENNQRVWKDLDTFLASIREQDRGYYREKLNGVLELDNWLHIGPGLLIDTYEPQQGFEGLHTATMRNLVSQNPPKPLTDVAWWSVERQVTIKSELVQYFLEFLSETVHSIQRFGVSQPQRRTGFVNACTRYAFKRSELRWLYHERDESLINKFAQDVARQFFEKRDSYEHLDSARRISDVYSSVLEVRRALRESFDHCVQLARLTQSTFGNIEVNLGAVPSYPLTMDELMNTQSGVYGDQYVPSPETIQQAIRRRRDENEPKYFAALCIVMDNAAGMHVKGKRMGAFSQEQLQQLSRGKADFPIENLSHLDEISTVYKTTDEGKVDQNSSFKEDLIEGHDVSGIFNTTVDCIEEMIKKLQHIPGPVDVIIGRGKTTGSPHAERLASELTKRGYTRNVDFTVHFGYWAQIMLSMPLGRKVFQVSMVLAWVAEAPSGSLFAPNGIRAIVTQNGKNLVVRRCNITFENYLNVLVPSIPQAQMSQLGGIININDETQIIEETLVSRY